MSPRAGVGLVTTVLSFIGGVWLFLAPFIVGYQAVGEGWIRATKNDLWTGGVLMAISALALFLFVAFALRDAAAAARRRQREERKLPSLGDDNREDKGPVRK